MVVLVGQVPLVAKVDLVLGHTVQQLPMLVKVVVALLSNSFFLH